MELIRLILSLPFSIIGALIFNIAEIIAGRKVTYRGHEVLNILERTAECTKCGHKGTVFKKD